MTALVQDVTAIKSKEQINTSAQIAEAARASGRNPFSLALDFYKLRRKPGKLRFYEYILYELYDRDRWSDAEREEFVSAHVHWPLVNPCNNPQWWALTEDKWLSACFLERNGMPAPKTLAVFDRSTRHYGTTRKLSGAEDLKAFLSDQAAFPIFAKPIGGMWSAGALRISAITDTHVLCDGKEQQTYAELADSLFGDTAYILQTCLTPHGFFDGITDAIATVRCLNLIDEGQHSAPYALLKLPRQGNIADNFWRPGNLLCNLDPDTGEIIGIVSVVNGRRVELDALPDSDRPLVGETLPHWEALKELNRDVALLHAENHYGSTDIALTDEGPVVVEVNNGCAFELMQIGTGKGFLDARMTEFFRKHGAKI